MEVCRNTTERNHRFLEEALELVQAMGSTPAEAHMLVDYVFGRPVGDPEQEVGGAMVTLAALCAAADISMAELAERELARCWVNIDRIRFKQAGKPRHSPLPGPTPSETRARRFAPAGTDGAAAYKLAMLCMQLPQYESDQILRDATDDVSNRFIEQTAPVNALKANQQSPTSRPGVASDALGIAWWNGCSDAERAFWLKQANSAVPADAWQAYKNSDKTYDGGDR